MKLARVSDSAIIDGEKYVDEDGNNYIEVPSNSEAQQQVSALRRRLVDLPDVPQRMNTISVVVAYELFGLSAKDIALAVGLSEAQVGNIMMLDAYSEMRDHVIDGIRENDASEVRDVFVQKSKRSAERIVELAESGRPDIALSASKEVLDRSGHTVKQIVEHKHKMDDALRIEIIKRDVSEEVPDLVLNEGEYREVKPERKN